MNWLLTTVIIAIAVLCLLAFDTLARRQDAFIAAAASAPGEKSIAPISLASTPGESASPSVEAELRAAVERANTAFIAARGEGDAAALQAVATGEWLAQERAYIAAMRARGETEQWRLLSIEFVEIVADGNRGAVCTRERWSFTRGGRTTEVSYFEVYTLFREGVDWRVSQIRYS
jgi:hypothetical protein